MRVGTHTASNSSVNVVDLSSCAEPVAADILQSSVHVSYRHCWQSLLNPCWEATPILHMCVYQSVPDQPTCAPDQSPVVLHKAAHGKCLVALQQLCSALLDLQHLLHQRYRHLQQCMCTHRVRC